MDSGLNRKLDYDDYVAAPDDGKRYEIVRGSLYVTPAPSLVHQRVSRRLLIQLVDHFHKSGSAEVFDAPVDLILTPNDVLQPDLVVIDSPSHMTGRGIEGPPLLVVEILSPSTQRQDRGVKFERYAELGVHHYWIVDPDARRVEWFHRVRDRFEPLTEARGGDVMRHETWQDFELHLEPLWRPSPMAGRKR